MGLHITIEDFHVDLPKIICVTPLKSANVSDSLVVGLVMVSDKNTYRHRTGKLLSGPGTK